MRVRRRISTAVAAVLLSGALTMVVSQTSSAVDAGPEQEPVAVTNAADVPVVPVAEAMGAVETANSEVALAAIPICEAAGNQVNVNFDNGYREFYQYVPLTNTSPSYANCYLQQGVTSPGVKALQIALNACYGQGLATDGIFGAATKAALIRVQKSLVVTADGIYGAQTRAYLKVPGYWVDNGGSLGCQRA